MSSYPYYYRANADFHEDDEQMQGARSMLISVIDNLIEQATFGTL